MKKLKKLLCSLLAVTMILPQVSVMAVSAEESSEAVPVTAESELLKAGSISASESTITEGQPFAAGTAGSDIFRIPCLITLDNGNLLAAADARYTEYRDFGGIDTIASVSADNGATWQYSFPIYFPDSDGSAGYGEATTAIDPMIVQGNDGTIYCMADMNPTGVTTLDVYPLVGTGFVTVNDVERLALTSNYDNASTLPTDDDTTTYEYYVGDFDENGFAAVMNRADNTASSYVVDEWYNLYSVNEAGEYVADLTQTQVDTDTVIQQNAFYADSALHVYNTGYIWLVTSKDNGLSWENPRILNPMVKRDDGQETALLVSPGQGMVTSNGDIIVGCYDTYSGENASIFYSTDNGATWNRSNDVSVTSSENEIIELPDGTLRMFYRSNTMKICYADIVKNDDGTYTVGAGNETSITVSSNCNVSAIMLEDTTIDGKPVVLVSNPEGPGSWNRVKGRIFVFTVNEDNSMNHEYTFAVNEEAFAYSCMTELDNGNIGMLWEPGINQQSAIRYDEVAIELVTGEKILKDVVLEIGEAYTESYTVEETMTIVQEPNAEVATLEMAESIKKILPLYDHSGTVNTTTPLSTFSSSANADILLENAEFEFIPSETENLYQIYNEFASQYLTNASSATAYFSSSAANMYVESVTDETTGEVEFRISKSDQTRYVMFYLAGMNFNGNSGSYNSSMADTYGSQELVLLEKLDVISDSDIIPGYGRATEIKADTKYLITYIYDGRVIVLYPVNGTNNQTKLVGSNISYTMYDSGSTTANTGISLTDAELVLTKVDDNNNWKAYNENTGTYLTNTKNSSGGVNFYQTAESTMTLTPTDGKFTVMDSATGRYIIFNLKNSANTYNAMSSTSTDTSFVYNLTLLEKQDAVTESDVLPGYKEVSAITDGKTYLIAYVDGENVYVLYPSTSASSWAAMTKRTVMNVVAPVLINEVTIEGVAKGTTTAVIDNITYNIKVKSPIIVSDAITATAGNESSTGPASNAVDNNSGTLWHSNYSDSTYTANYDYHWITIDLGKEYLVDGLRYLTRSSGGSNGIITEYEVYYSTDGVNFTKATEGSWGGSQGTWYEAEYDEVTARYIKLKAVNASTDQTNKFASAAEIQIRGVELPEMPIPESPFDDVVYCQYCFDAVVWAKENGITSGITETLFAPNWGVTRADVVTFLWRAAGQPEASIDTCDFVDISEDAYYFDAVLWGVENGIIAGTSETTFEPDAVCTRGQIVTFIWRAVGEPAPTTDTCSFLDITSDKYYATAVIWAAENNLVNGYNSGHFAPNSACTRAEMVAILYRYYN